LGKPDEGRQQVELFIFQRIGIMKILMELFVVITFLGNASLCYSDPGTTFKLGSEDFKSTAIIVTEANDAVSQFAAMELQKHLSLITGYEFPIKKSDEGYFR
jgi:hypothetical protein